ncbi:hypothetical protein M407DRAFT_148656 [Tulasnella calospora MUT 4182]|uniref:Uncharacterized protein n=1 Tax=Tulasnella calospora MUT 4182 TaxID=1051891 RepID=A0A0C3Q756_9AGAM|nr:hypothetical protein M407DRAFT_148656 [Tulasnella calospora MUT 4182]
MIFGEDSELTDQQNLDNESSISQHHTSTPDTNGSPPPPYSSDTNVIISKCLKAELDLSLKPVTSSPSLPSPDTGSASASPKSGALAASDDSRAFLLSFDHYLEQSRMLDKVEAKSRSSGITGLHLGQPTIKALPNSILWLKLVRSRFLLIQSSRMVLDLWDLTAPVNCVASCSVDGVVDGAVIEDEGDPHSTGIFVSTRSYTVYWLRLGPSGFGESQAASPWLTSSVMFCGLSEVVDARGPLFALLHLEGQGPGAFIKNNQNGAVVELVRSLDPIVGPLQPNDGSQTSRLSIAHNGIIDIQILDNTIVVARYCNFDLYSLSQVTKKLLDGGESAGISAIKACRRIDYPDLKLPVYQGGLLRQPNPYLGVESGACVLFSAELPSCYAIISRSSEAASVVTPPEVRCLRDFVQVTEPLFHFALGASGRRLAVLSDKYLTVYFTSRPDLDNAARRQDSGDLMACWMIPKSLGDIPVALDFDEATGRCVAAMASGRIWVKETANFLSETPISSRATKIPDFVCLFHFCSPGFTLPGPHCSLSLGFT